MTWFVIKYGGQTYDENFTGTDEKELVALGFHGYATNAEAQAHPNSANALQMLVAADILAGNVPVGVTNTPNPDTVAQGAGTATGGVDDIINFLKQGSIWLRGAEILAGTMLVYLGLKASMTPGGIQPAQRSARQTFGSTAKKVAKVIAK